MARARPITGGDVIFKRDDRVWAYYGATHGWLAAVTVSEERTTDDGTKVLDVRYCQDNETEPIQRKHAIPRRSEIRAEHSPFYTGIGTEDSNKKLTPAKKAI